MCGIAGIFLLDSANKYKLKTIEKMTENGVAMFRINLSHTALDVVEDAIKKIQSWTNVPVCLDSEGAQIRNQNMINESVFFKIRVL